MPHPPDLDASFLGEWLAATGGSAARRAGTNGLDAGRPGAVSRPARGSRDRAALLARVLGVDQPAGVPLVGVVGSKGKGTVVLAVAATLVAAGLTVGTITGPGLRSSRERLRIDGTALLPGDYGAVAGLAASALAALPPPARPAEYVSPSALYLLAGTAHLASRCDVIVAEAGIGGASDELSLLPLTHLVATAAFLEHTALLGATATAIAAEKVGAAGRHCRAIYFPGDDTALAVAARRRAEALGDVALAVPVQVGAGPGRDAPTGSGSRGECGHVPVADGRPPNAGPPNAGPPNGRLADAGLADAGQASTSQSNPYPCGQSGPLAGGRGPAPRVRGGTGSRHLNRFPFAVRAEFAGGFGARGLALGVAVGREVARAAGIDRVDPDKLAEVLASVRNPGRGSVHRTLGGRRVIVDSPVTGEGLRVALASARSVLGGEPDLILVSLCADKDLEGFGAVLAGLRERTVFVSLPDSHLRFGAPPRWAGRHVTDKDLPALLNCGDVLAVGTALFTGAVLDVLGVPTESLLRRPAGRGASRPLRSAATPVDTNGGR